MKNWFLLSLALIVSGISFAQSDIAPYKQTKKLPDFEIETVGNGTPNGTSYVGTGHKNL